MLTEAESAHEPPVPALLDALAPESRALFLSTAELLQFAAGEELIALGAVLEHLFIVDQGILRAEVPDLHGLAVEVARFTRGDYCGEMAFFRNEPAAATVTAATASAVWRIPHATLNEIADRHPRLVREMAQVLAGRLAETNLRLRQSRPTNLALCLGDSPVAVAYLLQVARAAARHLGNSVVVLDLAGRPGLEHAQMLPSFSDLVADPSRLTSVEAFGSGGGELVGVIPGERGDATGPAFKHMVAEVRRVCELLIVFAPSALATALQPVDDNAVGLHFLDAGQRPVPQRAAAGAILLGNEAPDIAPGGIHAYRTATGEAVLRVVRANASDLSGERPANSNAEPWASVDWTARHLLRRKVGLALGAGGSKGYAHLGVIEGLRSMGVPIDYVAGSSIGAPLAAAVARGTSTRDVRAMLDATFSRAMALTIPFQAFFSSRILRRDMERYCDGQTFERLPIPLAITAVDLHRRSEVVFRSGGLARAIVASMAIPGIFPPVRLDGRVLVDGGLLNPVPISTVAACGADVVIGVKLTSPQVETVRSRRAFHAPPIVETIHSAFEVMQWKAVKESSAQADVSIEPIFEGPTGLRDFGRGDDFVAAGRAACEAAAAELRRILPWVRERV